MSWVGLLSVFVEFLGHTHMLFENPIIPILVQNINIWAATCGLQKCGILTWIDSDKPVQPSFKLRNSKRCSISSFTLIEYSSDYKRLWSDCVYDQADLRLWWSNILHCWKSHAAAHMFFIHSNFENNVKSGFYWRICKIRARVPSGSGSFICASLVISDICTNRNLATPTRDISFNIFHSFRHFMYHFWPIIQKYLNFFSSGYV